MMEENHMTTSDTLENDQVNKAKAHRIDLSDLPRFKGSGDDAERHDELLGEAHRLDSGHGEEE